MGCFPGFLPNERIPRLLDYIFVSPNVEVMRTETLPDCHEGRQCSDHRALMADVELR